MRQALSSIGVLVLALAFFGGAGMQAAAEPTVVLAPEAFYTD